MFTHHPELTLISKAKGVAVILDGERYVSLTRTSSRWKLDTASRALMTREVFGGSFSSLDAFQQRCVRRIKAAPRTV